MAVASLDLSLTEFRDHACAEVFAGGATTYDDLDAGEQTDIDRYILRGECSFWLHPPGVGAYVWSCLRDPGLLDLWPDIAVDADVTVDTSGTTVTASEASFYETMVGKSIVITTVGTFTISSVTSSTVLVLTSTAGTNSDKTFSIASDGTYRLPSDFESPESSTIVFNDNAFIPDITLMNEKIVTMYRATQEQTGYPQMACIRWQTSDGTAAQQQELVVWPEPDSAYSVSLPYMAQPQGMSEANPYPRGGPEMADCLLACVLSECESAKNGARGDRYAEAVEKCQAAAARDRTRHHNFIAGWMRPDSNAHRRVFDVKRLVLPTS